MLWKEKSKSGFTLVELLVVISIIALLLSVMMPALNQAKEVARALVCSAHMRVYGTAVNIYANDNDSYFPRYAAVDNSAKNTAACRDLSWPSVPSMGGRPDLTWVNAIAYAVGGEGVDISKTIAEQQEQENKNMYSDFRKCPSGKRHVGGLSPKVPSYGYWDGWIGCNYGGYPEEHNNIPWVWRKLNDPGFKMYDIRNPADCIAFIDTVRGWGMFSPIVSPFNFDWDGDGTNDGAANSPYPYNYGEPKIHRNKCNTVRADGHVEKLTFEMFQKSNRKRYNHIWRFR